MTTRRELLGLAATALVGAGSLVGRGTDSLLRFDPSVPADIRKRCRRVEKRLPDLIGTDLRRPVRVRLIDPTAGRSRHEGRSRFDRIKAVAQHIGTDNERPSFVPRGGYNASTREVLLATGNAIEEFNYPAIADIDPETVAGNYPDEPHIAHELTHAVQHDRIEQAAPASYSWDGLLAYESVWEGTATDVQRRYYDHCVSSRYDPCILPDRIDPSALPPRAFAKAVPVYINGAAFVAAVRERLGWDAVWAAHRSPPAMTAEIMFPQRFFDGPGRPSELTAGDPSGADWLLVDDDRMGVFSLYAKLVALDVVTHETADHVGTVTSEVSYRHDPLRGWDGDRLYGYAHVDDLDRTGYRWETDWQTVTDARIIESAVRDAYAEQGTVERDGWYLDGRFVTVSRNHTEVVFSMAPTGSSADHLLGED